MEPNIEVSYCNFWENADGDLQENCPGWGNIWTPWEPTPGTGNIFQNPEFLNAEILDFYYHPSSPCIDAGNPDETDPDETRCDIGAKYYLQYSEGDCNYDSMLNILDIIAVINNCILPLEESLDCVCGDLNNDGEINVLDIILIINLILES